MSGMEYYLAALFLILSSPVLAAAVQSAGWEKDANGTAVAPELVTAFHLDHKQKAQYATKFAYPNGGVIKCTAPANLIFPCVGEGSGYFTKARLVTPNNMLAWSTYACGNQTCVATDWKTAYLDDIIPVGTNTRYHFQYGNMTACLADGTECAYPPNSWTTKSQSPGIKVLNAPMYRPLVIHAQYYYNTTDGRSDIIAVDQYLFKGYGW